MRYFMLEQDKGYTDIPRLINWFKKLGPGDSMKSLQKFRDREVFMVKTGKSPLFIDIITDPVIMVTEKTKKCISLYEPNVSFKEIILLDRKKRIAQNYFVPFLAEIDCLTSNSEYTNWRYDLQFAEIDESKVNDKAVFIIKGSEKRNIVIRLDVVESLLRRGIKGFTLKEVEVRRWQTELTEANIW